MVALSPDGHMITFRSIETVKDALAILADERLAFAWPALLAWGGDDLHILRDRAVTHAKAKVDDLADTKPPQLRKVSTPFDGEDSKLVAMRAYLEALFDAGRDQEAIGLARQQIAKPFYRDNAAFARSLYAETLAFMLADTNRINEAIATLEQAATAPGTSPTIAINVNVNLALMLAQYGQPQRALDLIDANETLFNSRSHGLLRRIEPQSNAWAQFQWIRACALDRLGHHDDARAALSKIAAMPQQGPQMSTRSEARIYGFQCMGDARGLGSELAEQLPSATPASDLFLQFQPAMFPVPNDRLVIETAIAEPEVRDAIANRVRLLDGALRAPMLRWVSLPSSTSAPR